MGNFTKHERSLAKGIADKLNLKTLTIFTDTPYEIAKQRLLENRANKTRFDVNDEDFENTVREMEPPDKSEEHINFKYGTDLDWWIKDNFQNK
ncbi:MAG: hypothetical protein M1120_03190 [Patescibacteria group bacterium]|nr:hypothetical protein [Patescibacteria group bacterium]